ncbi:DUF1642 domain-containing protein [Listeria monocytogenes]|uniref:DUF1642 domain-containing protein n=1 Tax=Listeria monocytogenes TaxID=1639 RepID=UPI000BDF6DE5|nr:DUF1642 domain-containing protein [Listeria monocytogenes]MBV1170042.1 DUF1642 domain-containing protein [Listeria monocytogenes]MBV1179959.1 DUF1642 domain-containing protein [Listeria monocytogenes]MBV1183063.1 DUF1642 domain-containing protein [Listeria monocytogenes]MBV1187926.1 DUF1642 domain-containing protein [Listeria monocytogenes]MBV1189761.1 DUF1642 domain-containing protein [Listeria monocytogenes]
MRKITKEYVKGTKNYKQITDATTPTVPEFVAKWFEENKRDLDFNIWDYIYNDMQEDREDDEFYDFMNSNALKPIETLVMMQYGYYVEKGVERLYVVKLPQEMGCYDYFLTKSNGKVDITCFEGYPRNLKYHLTEAEIRSVWDGYMELAKEVE